MALTNIEAQKKLETYQALLDIAGSIRELAARPDFAELSKLAYSLPASDQKKADEGRAIIAELEANIAEQRTRARDLQDEQSNIDQRLSDLQVVSDRLIADRKALDQREDAVKRREKAADERDSKQNDRDIALSERDAKLIQREVALGNDIAKYETEKEESRKRAEEIRRLSEGM